MRKVQPDIWSILIAVLLIISILWRLLVHFQHRSEIRNLDPFALIPSDGWMVIDLKKTDDLTTFFLSDSLNWKALKSLDEVTLLRERLKVLDSLALTDSVFLTAFKKARLLVSLHTSIRDEQPVLLQLRFHPEFRLRPFRRMLEKQWLNKPDYEKYEFLGSSVFLLKPTSGKPIYATFFKGSLLLSPGRRLIEHAITQNISGSALVASAGLEKIRSISGRQTSNVFFDGRRICELMGILVDMEPPALLPCGAFPGWMGWDLALIDDEIRLTGFAQSEEEEKGYPGLFSAQLPSDPFLMDYIPSVSAAFALLNIEITNALADPSVAYFFNSSDAEAGEPARDICFSEFFGNSLATVMLFSTEIDLHDAQIYLIHINDPQGFMRCLSDPDTLLEQPGAIIPVDTVFNTIIWEIITSELAKSIGKGVLSGERPFIAFQDSVLLTGTSSHAIKQVLMQIYYGQVIGKEARLTEDFIFQQAASNLIYFVNIPYLSDMVETKWKDGVQHLLRQIGEDPFPLVRITAQFSALRNGFISSNISLYGHSGNFSNVYQPRWKTRLDTIAHTPPFGVVNHVDGSREIALQDLKGNFYLIDRFGSILRKKHINGLINSRIYQVDTYKNGRLQYLFSTARHIHLIDRNGNNVVGYPRRLPIGSDKGITLVDYDGDRNYRILFTGTDHRLYNIEIGGSPASGWLLPKLKEPAATSIEYLKLGDRNYLVVLDQSGRPYFFDRRGQPIIKVPKEFRLTTHNPVFALENNNKQCFVAMGLDGSIIQISETGEVETFVFDSLPSRTGFLLFEPGFGNSPTYVFSEKKEMRAFDRLGKLVFSQALPDSALLQLVKAGGDSYIGLTINREKQIFLFNADGDLLAPFPMKGGKGFYLESLFKDQVWDLITVQNNNLIVYELYRN